MQRGAWVVVALVALSGCSGVGLIGGDGTPAETVTPVPLTETATPAGTATPTDRPPGLLSNGSFDRDRLLEAHFAALTDTPFRRLRTVTYRRGDRARPFRVDRNLAVVEDGSHFLRRHRRRLEGRWSNSSWYVTADRFYRSFDGSTAVRPRPDDANVSMASLVNAGRGLASVPRTIPASDLSVTVVERAGERYYRLHTTRAPDAPARGFDETIENYTATLFVRPDGLVRTLQVSWDEHDHRWSRHVRLRIEYRDVGTATLETPRWVQRIDPESATPTGNISTPRTPSDGTASPTPSGTPSPTTTGS